MRSINMVVIHCSDTETGDAKSIRAFHMLPKEQGGRGWSDIGYHYVIRRDGLVQVGRPESEIGAHAYGYNSRSLGICLVGKHHFEPVQFDSLKYVVSDILTRYQLSLQCVVGHYEVNTEGKTCPNISGEYLRQFIGGAYG